MSTKVTDIGAHDRSGPRNIDARDHESTPSLLRRLVNDVSMLFAQELQLLKAETTESIADLKAATVGVAMGGAVVFMGLFFLLLAAVYGLGTVVDPWLAALIVGGVVTLIGGVMLTAGSKKLGPAGIAPRRTARSLRRDTQMIKGVANHEHD